MSHRTTHRFPTMHGSRSPDSEFNLTISVFVVCQNQSMYIIIESKYGFTCIVRSNTFRAYSEIKSSVAPRFCVFWGVGPKPSVGFKVWWAEPSKIIKVRWIQTCYRGVTGPSESHGVATTGPVWIPSQCIGVRPCVNVQWALILCHVIFCLYSSTIRLCHDDHACDEHCRNVQWR